VSQLRFIHVSDIHFGGYGPGWDENRDQRNELLMDVRELVKADGPADGVLVGGDVAYHGNHLQYADASQWLGEVCEAGECLPGRVWVVPGNHDIARPIHERLMGRRALLSDVRACEPATVQMVLNDYFMADPMAESLLHCMSDYNDFASQFGCETTSASLSWQDKTLELDGLNIYLSGLNSVIASDTHDWEEGPTLALGKFQCDLPRAPNRVHVAFVHHPPNWLRDWQQLEDLLRDRVHVLMFGHEHRYQAKQEAPGGTVEIFAGAVGPHAEPNRESEATDTERPRAVPSWNMVTLERAATDLVVTIDPRIWRETRFDAHDEGQSVFHVNLDLNHPVPSAPQTHEKESADASPLLPDEDDGVTLPPPDERSKLRELSVQFLKLTPHQRELIAQRLGVAEGLDDLELGPRGRPREILRRIAKAGKVAALREEMNA
jgi:calcineurin-like phosphoesterase family protein